MEIVLLWCFVLAWMAKRGAEDLVHAVKGTPNPRYELKKQRAAAAGRPSPQPPRYGGRDWFADLYSDALAAHTEKRRAAAKARPVDDMVDVVREPKRRNAKQQHGEPEWLTPGPNDDALLYGGRSVCPRCKTGQLAELSNGDRECVVCGPPARVRHETPEPAPQPPAPAPQPEPDARPTARIYQFPNPKHIETEIIMSNEANGLSTAIAFADAAASAHQSFATTGAEGYVGALERGGMSGEPVGTAREAMEASGIAAEKWAAHKAKLEEQLNLKEGYQSQPDAADKEYLLFS